MMVQRQQVVGGSEVRIVDTLGSLACGGVDLFSAEAGDDRDVVDAAFGKQIELVRED